MNQEINFDSIIGKSLGPRTMEYTWRDVALYSLGVGAGKDDLPYIYEKNPGGLKVLPTFGLIPYLNSITMQPVRHVPYGPNEIASDFIVEKLGHTPNRLHMAMELTIHKPIDVQGTFLTEDRLNAMYDRGEGKGVVADCQMDVYDRAGNPVCTLHSYHYHGAFGGYGGPKFDAHKIVFPERKPDYQVTEFMPENISVLYRLSGDTYSVHIDPAVAGGYGYKKPFNQGLCTFGFATRMAIQSLIPYQPERVRKIYAQMRSVCYPGQNVTFCGWKLDDRQVCFQLLDEAGETLLGNGVFEFD